MKLSEVNKILIDSINETYNHLTSLQTLEDQVSDLLISGDISDGDFYNISSILTELKFHSLKHNSSGFAKSKEVFCQYVNLVFPADPNKKALSDINYRIELTTERTNRNKDTFRDILGKFEGLDKDTLSLVDILYSTWVDSLVSDDSVLSNKIKSALMQAVTLIENQVKDNNE